MNSKDFRKWKMDVVRRSRSSPVARTLFGAATAAAEPFDYYQRRRAAAAYNEQFPSDRMSRTDGYAMFPKGTLPRTDELVSACRFLFAAKKTALDAAAGSKEAERVARKKVGFFKTLLSNDDLREHPVLVDFALSEPLFSTLTNYFGIVPLLSTIDLVYTVPRPNSEEFIASQLYHQDPEGMSQAKLFINIFDVREDHGPLMFLPAHDSEQRILAIRADRGRAGVKDTARYTDDELAAHGSLDSAIRLLGPAGTAAVVDTSRCLHAGSRIQPGHFRLVLIIQYCTTHEKANVFEATRYKGDPVRWLAVRRHTATES